MDHFVLWTWGMNLRGFLWPWTIYIHTYIHTYIYTHTYTHTYTYTYTHIYIHIYIYIHLHIHTYTHIHIYIYWLIVSSFASMSDWFLLFIHMGCRKNWSITWLYIILKVHQRVHEFFHPTNLCPTPSMNNDVPLR